jgi:methylmalonyl-CoA/ethylmalonyl-CoA epimerase
MPPTPDAPASPEFGLRRIHQIAVTVGDVDRATAFYRDTLGMPLLFQAPPGLAFFDCGGVRLMLSRPEGADTPGGNSIIYYGVDDIQRAHSVLTGRGVQFIEVPRAIARMADRDVWLAVFRDSEENLLGLMSEVPHSA